VFSRRLGMVDDYTHKMMSCQASSFGCLPCVISRELTWPKLGRGRRTAF
jgi:hypothetical protein